MQLRASKCQGQLWPFFIQCWMQMDILGWNEFWYLADCLSWIDERISTCQHMITHHDDVPTLQSKAINEKLLFHHLPGISAHSWTTLEGSANMEMARRIAWSGMWLSWHSDTKAIIEEVWVFAIGKQEDQAHQDKLQKALQGSQTFLPLLSTSP